MNNIIAVSYTHLEVYKRQQNGYVGGYMVKKMIEAQEKQMSGMR